MFGDWKFIQDNWGKSSTKFKSLSRLMIDASFAADDLIKESKAKGSKDVVGLEFMRKMLKGLIEFATKMVADHKTYISQICADRVRYNGIFLAIIVPNHQSVSICKQ